MPKSPAPNSPRRRRVGAAALISAALMLTACQTLPTSGPVTQFDPAPPTSASLQLRGYGPVAGDSPEGIVRDFLRASAAGWSDDFQVARSYLTPRAVKEWKPESQVQLYPNDQVPSIELKGEEVRVDLALDGFVTPNGQYQMQASPARETFTFTVQETADGQWRIDTLPEGVLVSQSVFQAAFQQANVYFLSPDSAALVGDLRWFPRRRLAGYLMQALLDGPTENLRSAVLSAAPEGAQLPLKSVELKNGHALVEISGSPLGGELAQQLFQWQVNATLIQVANVSDVSISVNGTAVPPQVLPTGPAWAMDSIVFIDEDGLKVSNNAGERTVLDTAGLGPAPTAPVIGPLASSPVAFISGGDRLMLVPDKATEATELFTQAGMSDPSIDRLGWVWTSANGSVLAAKPSVGMVTIPAPLPDGKDPITAIAISPDGARALVQRGGKIPSLWVAAVRRSHQGDPIALANAERLGGIPGQILDASWSGNNSVVALVKNDGEMQVAVSNLSMPAQTLSAPKTVSSISSGVNTQSVILNAPDGSSFQRSGGSWRQLPDGRVGESYPR